MPAVPPPILDYASRERRRSTVEDWRTIAADCGLIGAAVAIVGVVGLATTYVLHAVFVLCFDSR